MRGRRCLQLLRVVPALMLNNAFCYGSRYKIRNFAQIFTLAMRLFLILAVCLMPLAAVAQGVWERPDAAGDAGKKVKEQKAEKPNPDAKYLAGAVTEVDGKVVWTMDVDVPGKSADQIYALMLQCFTDLTKTENQIEGSCVALVNKAEHMVVATIREWLVFTDKFFALDRTKFYYTLIASCADNHLNVTMSRISYRYEEGREPGGGYVYKAEEWIDDKHALNKKKTRLLPGSAKFRRKTVDRKDYLFSVIHEAVLQ